MRAVRCIYNRLCREKLKRALQDMEAPVPSLASFFSNSGNNLKYAVFFAHKSNTSFGTVKGLLLFVCTHNINNNSQCFYKINRKTEDALSALSWTGALHNELKLQRAPSPLCVYLKSVRYEHSVFSALVWLAPGAEATLERASETSPVWCGHKDVLHLNKRNPFQEKRDRGSSCEWGGQP